MTVHPVHPSYAAVRYAARLCCVAVLLVVPGAHAADYSWNTPHATVLANGDLEWAPQPFTFTPGASMRYIDFANGDDVNDGLSKDKPWRHHPWDPNATGTAAAGSGIQTYVFKRGAIYRGQLLPDESGQAGNPIRLTSDPGWGTGAAWLYGSETVTNWQQGPAGVQADIPTPGAVWYADLNFLPRMVCLLDATGGVTRLALARTPNWTVTDPLDPLGNCWRWDIDNQTNINGTVYHLSSDSMLNNPDPNYYVGALVWTEWGYVMSAPYATRVVARDAARNAIAFAGPWGPIIEAIVMNQRYWLEDKPHYLDQPGEFWFESTGASSGRLYLRLPGDLAPTNAVIEAARHSALVYKYLGTLNHVEISGLSFRFANIYWPLEYLDWQDYPKVVSSAIHFEGIGEGLTVRNCLFEYVPQAIRFRAPQASSRINNIMIADNDIRYCDHGAISVLDGSAYEQASKPGSLGAVAVLRNRIRNTGLRPYRVNGHHTMDVAFPQQAEIAGNILDQVGGAGIFMHGGKADTHALAVPYDAPFTRIIVHHNKVKHALLCANDWGAIEHFQGGPTYVYNNVSWNPLARMNFVPSRWGGAYYFDGAFKCNYFNNIAWGDQAWVLNQYIAAPQAFMELIGFYNTVANNSAYRFKLMSRRQEANDGRSKYLGNVFDSTFDFVFEHTPSLSTATYDTLAFDWNVLTRVSNSFGKFEYGGATYANLAAFSAALNTRKALRWAVGVQTNAPVFVDAENGDLRPRADSAALNYGVQHFVPWALWMNVGEWHFVPNRLKPASVLDESWYMGAAWSARETYRNEMTFPLQGSNITNSDFMVGPLEDWAEGAVRLNGSNQYFSANGNGPRSKTLDIGTNNFVIEAYVRTLPDHTGGVLVAKTANDGYVLRLDEYGRVQLQLYRGGSGSYQRVSGVRVNDGAWHHVLVELRRPAPAQAIIYVDGVIATGAESGALPAAAVMLTNSAPFLVGKGPAGEYFAGELEFLRVARGSLTTAVTSIEELYDWEFSGPFLRDFCSVPPNGRRDAGALEAAYSGALLPRITRLVTNVVIEAGAAGGVRVATVNADGFYWSKDGESVGAATNRAMAFAAAQADDAGLYVLVVSNSAGVTASAPIAVSVIPESCALGVLLIASMTVRRVPGVCRHIRAPRHKA